MSEIGRNEIENILTGATFLGAGGGGPLSMGIDMLDKLVQEVPPIPIKIDLIDLSEATDGSYGAMVAGLGSPVAITTGAFGPDAVYAYQAFQKALAYEGKTVKYLYSGELGGFNTFVPMMVAMRHNAVSPTKIQFLDVDGNGRAVPELNTSLNSARGFPPNPIGLGTKKEDKIISYSTSSENAETIARSLCLAFDKQIGFSTWGMSKAELRDNAVAGALSLCEKIGTAIKAAKASEQSPFGKISQDVPELECKRVIRGTIKDISIETVGGFDIGKTKIEDDTGETFIIDFQNENLVIRDLTGEPYITVPELICMVTTEDNPPDLGGACEPLTNADTKVNMRVEIVISPAHPFWWAEDKRAYECWLPPLQRVGYNDRPMAYPGRFF